MDLNLWLSCTGDAAAHLREGLQLAVRTGTRGDLFYGLHVCGTLCAATGRPAEALTVWAAYDAMSAREGFRDPDWLVSRLEAQRPRPGRRSSLARRRRPRTVARS